PARRAGHRRALLARALLRHDDGAAVDRPRRRRAVGVPVRLAPADPLREGRGRVIPRAQARAILARAGRRLSPSTCGERAALYFMKSIPSATTPKTPRSGPHQTMGTKNSVCDLPTTTCSPVLGSTRTRAPRLRSERPRSQQASAETNSAT